MSTAEQIRIPIACKACGVEGQLIVRLDVIGMKEVAAADPRAPSAVQIEKGGAKATAAPKTVAGPSMAAPKAMAAPKTAARACARDSRSPSRPRSRSRSRPLAIGTRVKMVEGVWSKYKDKHNVPYLTPHTYGFDAGSVQTVTHYYAPTSTDPKAYYELSDSVNVDAAHLGTRYVLQ